MMTRQNREDQQTPPAPLPVTVTPRVPDEIPETVSPWETWHSEAYLIAHLTRHHGWHAISPGQLLKVRNKPRRIVPAPARPEVA